MALQEVGVEAIVKGLAAFQGDMRKMNSSLQDLRGEGTLLQRAFGGITDAILGFGEHIVRVAEVALGVLLRDAIRAVIDAVKEMISATIEAGNEFQTLEIRLKRLNFNTLVESGMDYNEATKESIRLTKEQFEWLQLLAVQTPYDLTDISNVFTLARSYGFANEEAKSLTGSILDFASGMGLGNQEIERIIINFGQLVQQGKLNGQELRDLARGAFVPVNDILTRMRENMGLTTEEFEKMRKKGELTGDAVQMFIQSFQELVSERFAGATQEMSNTFQAATDNVRDLIKGIFGLNTVKPVLDVIGQKVAAFVNTFTDSPERWEKLVKAAQHLGRAIASLVEDLLGLVPSADGFAEAFIHGVKTIAFWIDHHRDDIVGFFVGIGDTIRTVIVPFITERLVPAFEGISEWFYNNRNVITLFFQAIRDIFSEFIGDLLGGQGPVKDFGAAITEVMWFVINNKDAILKWIEVLWSVFAVWQVVTTVLNIVGGVILSVIGFVLGIVGAFTGLIAVVNFAIPLLGAIGAAIAAISLPVLALGIAVAGLAYLIIAHGNQISVTWNQLVFITKYAFNQMWSSISTTWNQIVWLAQWAMSQMWTQVSTTAMQLVFIIRHYFGQIVSTIQNINWYGIGSNMMLAVASGITAFSGAIVRAARNAALAAYNAALSALGIHSPSKLFFEIGANTMEGMAMGIQKAAGLAAVQMQGAMARVASAAVPSVTNSTTYNSTANYNLTVNSGAPTEPIIQDFNMLSSLAGV